MCRKLTRRATGGWSCLPTPLSLTPGTAQGRCFCAKHQENLKAEHEKILISTFNGVVKACLTLR